MGAAIQVTNLGKRYRITGADKAPYRTLRESLTGLATAPLRRLMGRGAASAEASDFWALKDVSFEVQPGEVVGIIGRNGAGKSTLLKILSRITKPTTGRVEINGRVGSLLEVGTGFHPELTGRENVYLNGSILGMSRKEIDRKFDEIVAFAEIDQFLDTPVKRYSSGMYVRLAFAVAAHLEPEILIVDEVLAVGDAGFQKKCLGKMGDVARGGRTIFFVSHNLAAVQSLCSRCIYLQSGHVRCNGETGDCIKKYAQEHYSARRHRVDFVRPSENATTAWMIAARLATDGSTPGTYYYGDSICIEVDFELASPSELPQLGLVITSGDGVRLFNANSHYQMFSMSSRAVIGGTITCNLSRIPLMVGNYRVSLWFGTRNVDTHVAEDALDFEVCERDIWGAGKVPPKGASHCWWPAEFEIHSGD
jgi:lipopolysaccharide transport system ATP-binding protein